METSRETIIETVDDLEHEIARLAAARQRAIKRAAAPFDRALKQHVAIQDRLKKDGKIASKARQLAESTLDAPAQNPCAICMDTHLMRHSVITSCGHCFGQDCLQGWRQHNTAHQYMLPCPLCKAKITSITAHTLRRTAKAREPEKEPAREPEIEPAREPAREPEPVIYIFKVKKQKQN
jgi:hypothetical protein